MLKVWGLGISFALISIPSGALGWGSVGHKIVAHVGSQLAGGFWTANSQGMVKLTTAPDGVYKRGPIANFERPTHYIQPDAYFEDPSKFNLIPQKYSDAAERFGAAFVNKNGTAPWRLHQYYDLAVSALKNKDYKLTLEYAAIMSHYVGDLSQPLHDTKNYDGQETNQPKIHSFFESTNIQAADQQALVSLVIKTTTDLLHDSKFRNEFRGSINDVAFNEMRRGYSLKDTLLAIDKKQGRTGKGAENLLKLAILRMADGAASLALILDHIWADAGNPSGGGSVDVEVPEWVKPDYGSQTFMLSSLLPEDDCG